MSKTLADLIKEAKNYDDMVNEIGHDEYDQGYTIGRLDGLRDAERAVSEQIRTPAEEHLIRALIAERNGVHSLPVKMALRAVKAERGM